MSDDKKIIFSMYKVSKTYPPSKTVIKDISLSFFLGAKIGIIGLNGSGKSTLLRIIAGEDTAYNGELVFAEGYSVASTYNGVNGLALTESEIPDLIILDQVLGDMRGEEVAAKLRREPETKDTPIIFLSALFSNVGEIEKSNLFCNCKIFAKPYDMKKLLSAIDELLYVSNAETENYKNSNADQLRDKKISVLISKTKRTSSE